MKKIIAFGIILAFLLLPSVQGGLTWDRSCINSTHLLKETKPCISGVCYTLNDTDFCPYGCEDNITTHGADCIDPPYIITLEVIGGVVILFIFIIWMGRRR